MQRLIGIFAIILLAVIFTPSQTRANVTAQIFPPATSAGAVCSQGQQQLLMWDGQHQVHCIPIPTCAIYAPNTAGNYPFQTSQLLQFDPASMQMKCVNPGP